MASKKCPECKSTMMLTPKSNWHCLNCSYQEKENDLSVFDKMEKEEPDSDLEETYASKPSRHNSGYFHKALFLGLILFTGFFVYNYMWIGEGTKLNAEGSKSLPGTYEGIHEGNEYHRLILFENGSYRYWDRLRQNEDGTWNEGRRKPDGVWSYHKDEIVISSPISTDRLYLKVKAKGVLTFFAREEDGRLKEIEEPNMNLIKVE